jgi:cation diffusion facilitator CzcD-associated flavoprotein CzcO
MTARSVAVIGAGPCGLPACKALGEFGIDYECLEASDSAGGIWNVERGPGGGYRSLQTNTSTGGMAYSDFPFGENDPIYPKAQEMLRYFQSYAEKFQLSERIRFGQRVERARPLEGGGWQLEFGTGETREYRALVVATGQYNFPRRPHDSVPGEFSGQQLHVFDYLDASTPVDCRGKRVVVVGLGSSAAELAADLSDPDSSVGCASQVVLSARSGRWVLPKMIDGVPLDARAPHPAARPPAPLRLLPGDSGPWALRRIFGKVLRAQFEKQGGAQGLGLPEPTIEPWEDRPTLSLDFIPALQAGRIDVRAGIRRFEGSTVHFDDGTRTEADVILYATGYQLHFPYLELDTLGCAAPELALYQRISHPIHDDLFFVGCCRVMCSMWPLAEQQSRWVARLLSGSFELPPRDERTRQAVPLASSLPVMCNFYVEALRKEAGGL